MDAFRHYVERYKKGHIYSEHKYPVPVFKQMYSISFCVFGALALNLIIKLLEASRRKRD